MGDELHPSSKPNHADTTTATAGASKPRFKPPPSKTTPPNSTTTSRHLHRPNPTPNNQTRRRRCLCLLCFWSILTLTLLLTTAAVAACLLYLTYHPHRPTFSVAAVKIHDFHLTTTNDDTTTLTSNLNVTISTKNPNKRTVFFYDPFAITCFSDQTLIANGSFLQSIVTIPNNITIIRATLSSKSVLIETQSVNEIRSNLKRKLGLPLKLFLDTEARVKIESLRTKKVGIRIKCEGIHSLITKSEIGKSRNSSYYVIADVSGVKCEFDLRIKIWIWTF